MAFFYQYSWRVQGDVKVQLQASRKGDFLCAIPGESCYTIPFVRFCYAFATIIRNIAHYSYCYSSYHYGDSYFCYWDWVRFGCYHYYKNPKQGPAARWMPLSTVCPPLWGGIALEGAQLKSSKAIAGRDTTCC